MIGRTLKMRWRRKFRRQKRQMEDLSFQAEVLAERHLFKRLNRLLIVRRFAFGWVLLCCLLITGLILQTTALSQHYQELKPAPGGIYSEGMIGTFTNANPVYAVSSVDNAASRLLFASLFKYDNSNQLIGDLAEKFTVDEKGSQYAVTLRDNLLWHDGKPLTADDIIFTYTVIQNPDAKSPLFTSWQGIKVSSLDKRTIIFTLPTALSAFPYSLVNGIIPKHLLGGVPMSQLRSVAFNTASPIGAGPFKWEAVEVSGTTPATREQRIAFIPNEHYHSGPPALSRFVIRTFVEEGRLLESFKKRELNGIAGLDSMPDELNNDASINEYNAPITGGVFTFFKNTHEILGDAGVRRALVMASNTNEIISGIGYPVIPLRQALLESHVGHTKELVQFSQNIPEANKLLDESGWKTDADGIRKKAGKPLAFRLYSQNTSEYTFVTQVLQKQWRAVGANVEVLLQPESDLQTTIGFHNYDALLYGISLGNDPDVFAYWHSSQADLRSRTRLNFSEYKSIPADRALEAGRTRSDGQVRAIKYRPFLESWRNDAPALALYQPRFLYVTRGQVFGLNPQVLNTGTDRYNTVDEWMIRQAKANR